MTAGKERFRGFLQGLFKNTLLLVVVVLLIGVGIGVALVYEPGGEGDEDDGRITALAASNATIARVGEPFNFSSEGCTGKIASYCWEFGDGNSSTEPNPTYAYDNPGWYNVTLVVANEYDMYTNNTIVVGVQCYDVHAEYDLGRDWELRPRYIRYRWEECTIGPNLEHPTTEVFCNLEGAYGTFEVSVYLWIGMGGGWYTGTIVDSELLVATGSLDYTYTIEPEECPEDANSCEIAVEVELTIREGVFTDGVIGFDASFPMEGISPPS